MGLPKGEGQMVKSQKFLQNRCLIGASHLGRKKEVFGMLDLAVKEGVKS